MSLILIATILFCILFNMGPACIMFVYVGEISIKKFQQQLNSISFIMVNLAAVLVTYLFPLFKTPNVT